MSMTEIAKAGGEYTLMNAVIIILLVFAYKCYKAKWHTKCTKTKGFEFDVGDESEQSNRSEESISDEDSVNLHTTEENQVMEPQPRRSHRLTSPDKPDNE